MFKHFRDDLVELQREPECWRGDTREDSGRFLMVFTITGSRQMLGQLAQTNVWILNREIQVISIRIVLTPCSWRASHSDNLFQNFNDSLLSIELKRHNKRQPLVPIVLWTWHQWILSVPTWEDSLSMLIKTAGKGTLDSKLWIVVAISSKEDKLRIKLQHQGRERAERAQEKTKLNSYFCSKAPIF